MYASQHQGLVMYAVLVHGIPRQVSIDHFKSCTSSTPAVSDVPAALLNDNLERSSSSATGVFCPLRVSPHGQDLTLVFSRFF